ncbi:hypothetical protein DFQ27_006326 [Actinomortierella ambigua]|uniref:Methylated-DNA--protein-cysteine methyltransferase n=1 Tax=Actinomortierella ambigua TaxID=1343610 RepID=A0A9P6PZN2_9FUNG|nr:hypothetical protein DFQ27_006326 [Actinomortierella ambigua]
MPAQRILRRFSSTHSNDAGNTAVIASKATLTVERSNETDVVNDDITTTKVFPTKKEDRENAVNSETGRRVTPFQFQVYDLCAQIPKGKVSTYKHISDALNASPRAVGQALKINPYAPLPVPCHRVLDSKLFIGGFQGQWGSGGKVNNKRAKLAKEGVIFDDSDHVRKEARELVVFTDFVVPKTA